jgi:hypothetical protein
LKCFALQAAMAALSSASAVELCGSLAYAFTHCLKASVPWLSPFALHAAIAACYAGVRAGDDFCPAFACVIAALTHWLNGLDPGVSPFALQASMIDCGTGVPPWLWHA